MSTWSLVPTWNAWAKVTEIGDGPAPVEVVLRAERDQTVRFYEGTDSEYETFELVWGVPGEGVAAVEVRLTLEFEPSFKVGDRVHLTGNFDQTR